MRHLAAVLAALTLLSWAAATAPAGLDAQTVTVRLEGVGGDDGVVADEFRTALRSLEAVELTGRSGLAEYIINVSTLCVPESGGCGSAEAFAVTVVLSEPLTGAALKSGLGRTGDGTLDGWTATPQAEGFFQRYRRMHAVWTARWGADRVQERVGRLVQSVEARCFQKRRTLKRRAALEARNDSARARLLVHEMDVDGDWLC